MVGKASSKVYYRNDPVKYNIWRGRKEQCLKGYGWNTYSKKFNVRLFGGSISGERGGLQKLEDAAQKLELGQNVYSDLIWETLNIFMIIYLVYFLFTKLMLFINQSFITRILAYFRVLYFFGTLNHKPYFWHSVNLSRRLGWPSTEPFNQSIAWFAKPGMPDYCLHNQGCQITACKIRDAISFLAKPGILEYFQKQGYLINAFKTRGAQVLLP